MTDLKPGEVVELKQERRSLAPILVTIVERSQRYAGWTVTLPSGCQGIALDNELQRI
jgi:hypothetical protein